LIGVQVVADKTEFLSDFLRGEGGEGGAGTGGDELKMQN
jgi:hypothetical protein